MQKEEEKNEGDLNFGHLPCLKNIKMGSILTEKISWLLTDPRTITKNTRSSYIYISR